MSVCKLDFDLPESQVLICEMDTNCRDNRKTFKSPNTVLITTEMGGGEWQLVGATLCMSVFLSVYVCVSVCMSLCMCVLFIYVPVCVCLCVFVCVCVCVCMFL